MSTIRWGIVSTGTIANTFASDIALVPNAEAVAVASRSLASASRFADRHGIPRSYQGYEELYADPDVDAIYIGTPHTLHFENAADALRAGKAVMCEKPITTSAADCQALFDIARESGGYLMEAMWTWYLPAIRQAKEWVGAGRIGELRHIKADFGYPVPYDPDSRQYNASLAGGCLLDMGIYPIALARYFGEQAANEMHVVSRHAPNGVDDDVVMLCNYDEWVASLAASFRCKLQNTAYIIGTEGYIAIPHFWRAEECTLFVMHDQVDAFSDGRTGSGFEFQIEAISDDIARGFKESRVVPHAASLAFQQDMDRARALFNA